MSNEDELIERSQAGDTEAFCSLTQAYERRVYKGKQYEWLSSEPILPGRGSWNLWVLHDPTYLPFGSQAVTKHEKSKLEKWDDSVKAAQEKATRIGDPLPSTFRKPIEEPSSAAKTQRFRVMVGAADRIENLWPK